MWIAEAIAIVIHKNVYVFHKSAHTGAFRLKGFRYPMISRIMAYKGDRTDAYVEALKVSKNFPAPPRIIMPKCEMPAPMNGAANAMITTKKRMNTATRPKIRPSNCPDAPDLMSLDSKIRLTKDDRM